MKTILLLALLLIPSVAQADRLLDVRVLNLTEPTIIGIDGVPHLLDSKSHFVRVLDDAKGVISIQGKFGDTPGKGPQAPKAVVVK